MSTINNQIGYVKNTDRRTCKMIKGRIANCLMYEIGVLNLVEEPITAIIHNAFNRAIEQLETNGFLSVNDLRDMVRNEYFKVTGDTRFDSYAMWFDDYNPEGVA